MRQPLRALAAPAAVFALALALVLGPAVRGQRAVAPGGVGPLPLLGTAYSETTLMGAAPGGLPGEAWGYRQLPLAVGAVEVGNRQLPMGPPLEAANPGKQL